MGTPVRSTYRVQLTPDFGLDRTAALVPYLARLGISHLYTSPLAEANPGSTHGYDVTDHQKVRAELGGEPALRRLWEALDGHGMGMVVDIVPNHMGIRDVSNRWWQDVLRHGHESPYSTYFDIDWNPPDPEAGGKVVLPFLDRPLEQAFRDGAIRVERLADSPELEVCHHGDRWPASEASLAVLGLSATDCAERFQGAIDELHSHPEAMARFLDAQHWRAVHWRLAPRLLNWRRFFDVTDLASVRVERATVFDDVHAVLRRWLHDDELGGRVVQGVRVDHVDGLVDPQRYLERLRHLVGPDRLLVVEKILAADEALPASWPVDGTTGYEVTARINEAVTDPAGALELRRRAEAFTGDATPWVDVELECKRIVARRLLEPEVERLTRSFVAAVEEVDGVPPEHDVALEVVRELAAELSVYRTYARPGTTGLSDDDRARIEAAAARLVGHRPDLPAGLVATARALLARERGVGTAVDEFASRFGQVSAPLAAKAVEDTAFYRAVALPWLNEVGGDPGRPGAAAAELQRAFAGLGAAWPGTFSPLTTHDTKRGADVRARLSRLAARPAAFADAVDDWHQAAAAHCSPAGPDPALEWLLWTTLVGAWPIDLERMSTYATKAMREAKLRTSWTDPDDAYEQAVHRFLAGVLGDAGLCASIERFVAELMAAGRAASLAQVVLAATAVGTPDLYQGDELWNLVLVDPDNRRPVDFDRRAEILARVEGGEVDLAEQWRRSAGDADDDGTVKLALWHRLLALRAERPDAFRQAHVPLEVDGPDAEAHLAFRRGLDVAVVVPVREVDGPPRCGVELPEGTWCDVLTGTRHPGGRVAAAELVDRFPAAVLTRL